MKYEHVPDFIIDMAEKVKAQHFPNLANAKILYLINKKKMTFKGSIALGKIMKPSDIVRFLSREEAPEDGYDYIMLLDGRMIKHCEEGDIEKVLRHEFRHVFYDPESIKSPYKLVDHDFSDFYAEVELNKDDPTWAQRVARTVSLIYDQEKDEMGG